MVLHFTGGKVGAANLWRKSVDDTLAFGWTSFLSVRSTFLVEGRVPQLPAATEEPLVSIPLNVDRLRSERLPFLNTLQVVLAKCHPLHSTLVVNRLARAIVPLLSVVLAKEPDARESDGTAQGRSKKSKKRAREFEGDEVFKISREVVCPTADEGSALLAAFAAIRLVLQNAQSLSCDAVHFMQGRLVRSARACRRWRPGRLSADPKLHPLLLQAGASAERRTRRGLNARHEQEPRPGRRAPISPILMFLHRALEVLLHPRLPPLVRSMPYVESLSVFRAEESQEESEMRRSLGLVPAETETETEDVVMAVANPPAPPAPPITSKNLPVPPSVAVPAVIQLPPQPPPQLTPKPSLPDDGGRIAAANAPVPPPTPAKSIDAPPVQTEMPIFAEEEEEKNEEMPAIDLGSDSDSDL
ncbi:hypothetical protein B0H14DRAFT_3421490 [Mycena olivaceomarginata]|nr:hypothetical protein B0H14DRAFT_3421490 [Mycena olivaceomarginata]